MRSGAQGSEAASVEGKWPPGTHFDFVYAGRGLVQAGMDYPEGQRYMLSLKTT